MSKTRRPYKFFLKIGRNEQMMSQAVHGRPQDAIAVELDAYRQRHGYHVVDRFPGIAPAARPRLAVRKRLVRLAKIQAMYSGKGHSMETAHIAAMSQFPTWTVDQYTLCNSSTGRWQTYSKRYLEVRL